MVADLWDGWEREERKEIEKRAFGAGGRGRGAPRPLASEQGHPGRHTTAAREVAVLEGKREVMRYRGGRE